VVNALPGMQPFLCADAEPLLGQTKDRWRRFICASLRGSDHLIEFNSKLPGTRGEQVIVDVRNDRKLKSRVQFPERIYCVGERLPLSNRVGQGILLSRTGSKPKPLAEAADYFAQYLAIRAIRTRFGLRFEIAIKLQQFGVGEFRSMLLKQWPQSGEDAGLPVDESAIAIERNELEAGEIEHEPECT